MKGKKACLLVGLLIQAAVLQAQIATSNHDLIEWNEYYKLRPEDFKGEPGEDAIGDAGTAVQIKAKPYTVGKKIMYDVYALFNKRKSWLNEQSAELLAHEQLHFDLAELYARKIRKKISELNSRNVQDVKVYNNAITELLNESNRADMLYDVETLHGSLNKKQAAWAKKIREEMEILERYKKTKRVIRSGGA